MKRNKAFTLIELLVSIAIIGVLIGLLIPAVQSAREAGRRMKCLNNVKNIVLAIHNYNDTHNRLPAGAKCANYPTWIYFCMPFCEQSAAYDRLSFDGPLTLPGSAGAKYDNMANDDSWDNKCLFADVRYALHSCPSDVNGDSLRHASLSNPFFRLMHLNIKLNSYMACAGNTAIYGVDAGTYNRDNPRGWVKEYQGVKHAGACFGMSRTTDDQNRAVSSFPSNAWITMSEIQDGLSNTMAVAETIQAEQEESGDLRGLTSWGPSTLFTTFIGPNSTEPDRMLHNGYCNNLPHQPCEGPDSIDGITISRTTDRSVLAYIDVDTGFAFC